VTHFFRLDRLFCWLCLACSCQHLIVFLLCYCVCAPAQMGRTMALGTSIGSFAASLPRDKTHGTPGTYNHYNSMDTQVLGQVLLSVMDPGVTLTQYLEEKIWSQVGFEADVHWLLDGDVDTGTELAFGTLNARTRDFARFGWLFLNDGRSPATGEQILPAAWVKASVTPDAPYLMPGAPESLHDTPFGYGYQWWIPEPNGRNDPGEFFALGIYGQTIYVNPQQRIVVARNSAWAGFNDDNDIPSAQEFIELARAIAAQYGSM
jgi:CubicO group peptidase (beta-lactamase class C family)